MLVVGRQEVKFIYDILTFGGTIAVFAIAHHSSWPVMTLIAALTVLKTTAYVVFFMLLLGISSTPVHGTRVAMEDSP